MSNAKKLVLKGDDYIAKKSVFGDDYLKNIGRLLRFHDVDDPSNEDEEAQGLQSITFTGPLEEVQMRLGYFADLERQEVVEIGEIKAKHEGSRVSATVTNIYAQKNFQ